MYIEVKKFKDIKENIKEDLKKNILDGKLIIYPTDTVYGLGATIENENALKNIYIAKTREFSSPLIALVSSIDKILEIAHLDEKTKKIVEKLAEKFWPGALTIILKKKNKIPAIMVSGGDTIGVRIPNLELSLEIIKLAGGILATTSANISGEKSPSSYEEVSSQIKGKVDVIVNGGDCNIGEASTIVDLSREKPKILRRGAIKLEEIQEIIKEIEV